MNLCFGYGNKYQERPFWNYVLGFEKLWLYLQRPSWGYLEAKQYHYQRGNVTQEEFKRANIQLESVYLQEPIQKERPTWTLEEFQKFLNTFEKTNKYYVLFEVFGHTGVRIGELRGLMVKNFDRKKKEIFINQQVTSKLGENAWKILTPKTKASIRHIPLSPRICLAPEPLY